MKTTPLQRAMQSAGASPSGESTWILGAFAFEHADDVLRCPEHSTPLNLRRGEVTVGEILAYLSLVMSDLEGQVVPPAALSGAGGGSLEDLLMKEADRLDNLGILTMARYPVASVMLPGSKFPMQKPSLPDFEGVMSNGRQFIIEAKVSTQASFRVDKDHLKPRQVSHMLTRSKFGVPCFLLIHFNARTGATFHDPPFTVGIPVRHASAGGLELWEKFADDKKGSYHGVITREEAAKLGRPMAWHVPPRCQAPRPDLRNFMMEVFDELA